MDIKIEADFPFTVSSISYAPNGQLCISLDSDEARDGCKHQYTASLGDGQSTARPSVSLLSYIRNYTRESRIKDVTKSTYRLMGNHL